MRDAIIYGAGGNGMEIYWELRDNPMVNILYFADRDINKQGTYFMGHEVIAPQDLKRFIDKDIYISVENGYEEIRQYLESIGCINLICATSSKWRREQKVYEIYQELNHSRCIDIGLFLMDVYQESELVLKGMPHIWGGSYTLDYAFLVALRKKFHLLSYLEIGSFVGTTLALMSEECDVVYSITEQPDGSIAKHFQRMNMPNYTNRLAYSRKIKQFFGNSQTFDYSNIDANIDLFFIDGDHSYNGVYCDTKNIFRIRNEDSFVVWHDFKQTGEYGELVLGVKDSLGELFQNVYITSNNFCAVYIPDKYKCQFPLIKREYASYEEKKPLYVYDTVMQIRRI